MAKKMKLSLGGRGPKKFFVEHGEKLVLGAAVLLLIVLAYSAFSAPTLQKQPAELTNEVSKGDRDLADSVFKKPQEVPKFSERVKPPSIATSAYSIQPISLPLVRATRKQMELAALPAEELRASAGSGLWAYKAAQQGQERPTPKGRPRPGPTTFGPKTVGRIPITGGVEVTGAAKSEQRTWVVGTGLVPIAKQRQAFAELGVPPKYALFELWRAEVSGADAKSVAEPDWKKVPPYPRDYRDFAMNAADVVQQGATLFPALTMKLPPLLKVDWNEQQVAHAPQIPASVRHEGELQREPLPPEPINENIPGGEPAPRPNEVDRDNFSDYGPPRETHVLAAQSSDEDERANDVIMPARPGERAAEQSAGEGQQEYLLLRFFDTTVEAGKRYVYRVKLKMEDPRPPLAPVAPNRQQARLAAPQRQVPPKPVLLEAPWSEPTNVVTVPRPINVLAGPVKLSANGDPKATVRLLQIDPETGIELSAVHDFDRGDALRCKDSNVLGIDWINHNLVQLTGSVEFDTGTILAGIRGGNKTYARGPVEPGEIQVVDADELIHVRRETEDAATNDLFTPRTGESGELVPKNKPGARPKRSEGDDGVLMQDSPTPRPPRQPPTTRPTGGKTPGEGVKERPTPPPNRRRPSER